MKSRFFVPVKERLNCTRLCIANSLNIWQKSFIEYFLKQWRLEHKMKTNTNNPIDLTCLSRQPSEKVQL